MRAWLVALLLAAPLSGCFGQEEEERPDPLVGWCPQWVQGPLSQPVAGNVTGGTQTTHLGPQADGAFSPSHDGRPLDLYRLRLNVTVSGGGLRLAAYNADDGTSAILRDTRFEPGQQVQPFARFQEDASDVVLEALLNPVDRQTDLVSAPLRLEWTAEDNATATWSGDVTFHYRVCGALT